MKNSEYHIKTMMRWIDWFLVLTGALLFAGPLQAYQAPERTTTAIRIQGEIPRIDGLLDDEIWQETPVFTGFTQREPKEGDPASERTTVQFAYDDAALYVAIVAYDREPDKIVARLVRRDQWTEADWVQIALDTHHDHQSGSWFEVNAGGSIKDGRTFNDDWSDDTWNGVWESAHAIHADGWTVEFRIPYHILRFSPADEYTWGVNVTRYVSRKKELVNWVMVPRKENGWISRFAHLEGIEEISPRRSLEFLPYSVGRSTFAPDGTVGGRELFGNLGLDLRYGITSGISLNATVNPDFGQVEADPAQLNLSVFETFQDERRPFFVEGSQYFQTPINLFYSRRVGRRPGFHSVPDGHETVNQEDNTTILGALKLTGKTASQTSFGLLNAVTSNEYARIDSIYTRRDGEEIHQYRDFLTEPLSNFLVGRVKQDFFDGSSQIGLMATALSRDGAADAYSGGLDWNLKWHDNGYSFWGHLAGSRATVDDERRSGFGNMAVLSKTSGWLRGDIWWEAFSRDFQVNDLGYQWRNDYYNGWLWIQLRKEEPWSLLRRSYYNFNRWGMWNFDEVTLEDGFDFNTHHELANYWWAHANYYHFWPAQDDLDTRGGPLIAVPARDGFEFELETSDSRMVSGWAEYEWERDSAGGWRREVAGGITVRPRQNVEISLRPGYQWHLDDAQWIENFDSDGDGTDDQFVYGRLRGKTLDLTTRVNVLFNRDLSLEFYLQPFVTTGAYGDYKELTAPGGYQFAPHPGPEESPDFRNRSLQSNLVFRWEYRPGSTLYVVWSQFRDDDSAIADFRPARDVARTFVDDGTNIFLIKFNYWMHM